MISVSFNTQELSITARLLHKHTSDNAKQPNTRPPYNYIFKFRDFQTFKYVIAFQGQMNDFIVILAKPDESL